MQTIRQDKHYKRLLTIAGSDSGGGAGIQADLKTFAALGCYGMSAITALTAQNTQGVYGIHPVPTDFVANQIDVIFNDIGADAVKIGMLFSSELIQVVAQQLKKHTAPNIVLDPVMVAQSGDKLLQDDAIEAIKTHLLPLADVITPNVPEAALLSGLNIGNENDIQTVAHKLSQYGQSDILIKGGHCRMKCKRRILIDLSLWACMSRVRSAKSLMWMPVCSNQKRAIESCPMFAILFAAQLWRPMA